MAALLAQVGGIVGAPPDEPSFVVVLDPVKDPLCREVRQELKITDEQTENGVVFGSVRDYRGKPLHAYVAYVPPGDAIVPQGDWTSRSGAYKVTLKDPVRNNIEAEAPGLQSFGIPVGSGTFCLEFVLGVPESMIPNATPHPKHPPQKKSPHRTVLRSNGR